MSIDDETLMAFADGELPAERAAAVQAAVAADAALAARVARFRAVREVLTDVDYPAPDAGALMTRAKANVARREPAWRPPAWSGAVAAGIAGLAIGAGLMLPRAGEDAGFGPDMQARGVLEAALDEVVSGGAVRQGLTWVSPLYTVTTGDGQLCRAFRAERGPTAREGVACRDGEDWRVVVVAQAAPRPHGFGQASTIEPAAVAAAVEALNPGAPLKATDEAALIARGWRRE